MKSRGLTTLGADSLLLAAAIIWGTGFVAQNLGSKHLSAFAFTGLRFTAGTLLLLPLLAQHRDARHFAEDSSLV